VGNSLLNFAARALLRAQNCTDAATVAVTRCYPSEIHHWVDFPLSALNFHLLDEVQLVPNRIYSLDDDNELVSYNESGVEERFIGVFAKNLNNLGNHIGKICRRTEFTISNRDQEGRLVIGSPDIVCCSLNVLFAIGEIKPFWNLERMPSDVNEMIRIYGDRNQNVDMDYERENRKWMRCVAQTNGYMIDNKVKYGFISGFNRTWFLMAEDNNEISISRAFLCDSGEAFRAFAYFLRLAKDEFPERGVRCPTAQNGRIQSPIRTEEDHTSSSSSAGPPPPATQSSHNYNTRGLKRSHSSSSSSSESPQWLSLGDCEDLYSLGQGRLGAVFGCKFRGEALAIKCVDRTKEDVTALEKEIAVYRQLEDFQGELIPQVRYYRSEVVANLLCFYC
jgi:hypothetical protein